MTRVLRSSLLLITILACSGHHDAAVSTRDDLGRSVVLPPHPHRVITLAPNLTEMVFAVAPGRRVIGTDDFSDLPPIAKQLPKVGGLQPDIEKIVALAPDLVLATTNGNHPNLAPALAAVHVPLFVVRTDRLEEIPRAMERLGGVSEGGGQSRAAVASVRQALEAQRRRRSSPPRVLFVVWGDPLYVAGRNTFVDDLFNLTGAQNAVPPGVSGWPQYSLESLAAYPPDLLLYSSQEVSSAQIASLQKTALPSSQTKSTFVAVDGNRFSRPGPRVGEAAAELNRILDRWEKGR